MCGERKRKIGKENDVAAERRDFSWIAFKKALVSRCSVTLLGIWSRTLVNYTVRNGLFERFQAANFQLHYTFRLENFKSKSQLIF